MGPIGIWLGQIDIMIKIEDEKNIKKGKKLKEK